MKTYEELRGMTQEDLVRLVLELQEEIIDLKKNIYGRKSDLHQDGEHSERNESHHEE
jgi:ribosomal protein L29